GGNQSPRGWKQKGEDPGQSWLTAAEKLAVQKQGGQRVVQGVKHDCGRGEEKRCHVFRIQSGNEQSRLQDCKNSRVGCCDQQRQPDQSACGAIIENECEGAHEEGVWNLAANAEAERVVVAYDDGE